MPARRRSPTPRIALVCRHSSPLAAPGAGRAGGMNVYVRELAVALARRGCEVDVLTTGRRDGVARLAAGVRLLELPAGPAQLSALPRYDVVHSHYWRSGELAAALAARSGARHVHTFHTVGAARNDALAPGETPPSAGRLSAERALAAGADAIVVSTAAERALLLARLGADPARVHIVAPGVDLARFAPASDPRAGGGRGRGERPLLAVHVGRIQPLKGIELALRALARIGPQLGRRCVLALAGGPSGPDGLAALRALRREAGGLPPGVSVAFLGRVGHGRLPSLLASADVAVVSSRAETFGLAALEAQACGTPVVGTAVGGLAQFVDPRRLCVREPGPFARALGEVLDARAPQRRAMRAAAADSARPFAWTTTAAGVAAAYGW